MEATAIYPWETRGRQALRAAMGLRGHDQTQCAARLRELGLGGANQSQVSKWLSGEIDLPRSRTLQAIKAYIEESPEPPPSSAQAPEDAFRSTVHEMTGEPAYGPLQTEFLRSAFERHRTGPPLSPEDLTAMERYRSLLGLAD